MRWDNATAIPQGTNITSAYVKFVADNIQSNTITYVTIKAAGSNDTDAIDNYTEWNSIPRTTASVNWVIGAWTYDTVHSTPDIKTVVQEAVNHAGFDGKFVFFFDDAGSSAGATRSAFSHEGNSGKAAILEVNYDVLRTYLWLNFTDKSNGTAEYYMSGTDISGLTVDVANDTGSGFGTYMSGVINTVTSASPTVLCNSVYYHAQGRWIVDIASGATNSKWRVRVPSGTAVVNSSCTSLTTSEAHSNWVTRTSSLGSSVQPFSLGLGYWP